MELKRNEFSKDVNGYEGLYAVTTLGRVWSYRSNRYIKPWVDGYGYMRVSLHVHRQERKLRLHRLIGIAFHDNPENKPLINHKSGDKKDCRACNLEWVTAIENLQHACNLRLNKTYKLSYHNKWLICKLYATKKITQVQLAKMFGVSSPNIHYIIKKYTPIVGNA